MVAWRRLRGIVSIAVLIAGLTGCGFLGGSGDIAPDVTPQVSGTSATRAASGTAVTGTILTNANWNLALEDADQYRGSAVDLNGQVFYFVGEYDGASHYQLFADPVARSGNTHLLVPLGVPKLAEGDTVHIRGTLDGMLVVSSRGGSELRLPLVDVSSFEVTASGLSWSAAPVVASTTSEQAVALATPFAVTTTETSATIPVPSAESAALTDDDAPTPATTSSVAEPAVASTTTTFTTSSSGPFTVELTSGNLTLSSAVIVNADPQSPDGEYLTSGKSTRDWNGNGPFPNGAGTVVFDLQVPNSGRYAIWVRSQYQSVDANSLWLVVDHQGAIVVGNEDGGYGTWRWVGWRDGNAGARITADLAAGQHTIALAVREPGTRLDRVLVTQDLNARPTDPPSAAAPSSNTTTTSSAASSAQSATSTPVAATSVQLAAPTATATSVQAAASSSTATPSPTQPPATATPAPQPTAPPTQPPATATPKPSPTATVPQPSAGSYTVQPGDSLSVIAQRMYGDASQYRRIYDANRDKLSSPDLIRPGQQLHIP